MDRLHLMTVFVTVAEESGFAAAARRLNMSPPAVTRAIAALEAHLGVELFRRTTRVVRTTETGERYLDDARRIIDDIAAVEEAAAGVHAEPRGRLVVTAPVMFGRLHVTPLIVEYLQRYTEASVSAMFVDRIVDLIHEGIDVGIRIGELDDSSLRARRIGSVGQIVCASPAYLKRHGIPKKPKDLERHTLIFSSAVGGAPHWRFIENNHVQALSIKARLSVSTNDAAIEAAVNGFGITRLLSYQVLPFIENGVLKRVLRRYEPPPSPVHIVHREGRYPNATVRAFIDLAVDILGNDKSLTNAR